MTWRALSGFQSIFGLESGCSRARVSKFVSKSKQIFGLNARFLSPEMLHYDLPRYGVTEIAFVGRSNVGKSKLIGSLLGGQSKGKNKGLVRVSKKPGKTKMMNFYSLVKSNGRDACLFVDLPGYGFAKASKKDQQQWTTMINNYVFGRESSLLKNIYLLVDSRYPIQHSDCDFLHSLVHQNVPFDVILTKADASNVKSIEECIDSVFSEMLRHQHVPDAYVHVVSAKTGEGMDDLKTSIASIVL
jgi:GTP-binding protein